MLLVPQGQLANKVRQEPPVPQDLQDQLEIRELRVLQARWDILVRQVKQAPREHHQM